MIDWRHWHNEPYLTGGIILLGWLYALLAGPFRAQLAPGAAWPGRQAAWFYASLILFYLAVGSPLDQVGERFLLTAHMAQHDLLLYPAPLLFLLGLPAWMIDPVLARPGVRQVARACLHPAGCALVSTVVISVWHAPALYEWTLQLKLAHVAEHLMFFAAALMYWWPLVSPSRVCPRPRAPVQMLYIFATEVGMIPVTAYLVFSKDVLYPTYEYAPRLIAGFSPLDDQITAGVVMKVAGAAVSLAAMGVVFYRWQRGAEGGGPRGNRG
jgi:putative membrane protein